MIKASALVLPSGFDCPDNMRVHLAKVFGGEYDIPLDGGGLTILDLGANCGAFAIWAAHRWPGSYVHCYEPVPATFEYLRGNVERRSDLNIKINNSAVSGLEPGKLKIATGKNNCGEASFYINLGQSESVEVDTVPPVSLPIADLIKLDIEGSELDVLFQLVQVHQRSYLAILLEYHSEIIRRALDQILTGYQLIKADIACPGRGTLCYVRSDLIK